MKLWEQLYPKHKRPFCGVDLRMFRGRSDAGRSDDASQMQAIPGGDSPNWAAAKAAAQDVLDTAFRVHMPLSGDMERSRVAPYVLEAIQREIANALFKAWQD